MKTLTLNQRVAKPTNKQNTEFRLGVVTALLGDKAKVAYDNGGAYWCNISNLELVD